MNPVVGQQLDFEILLNPSVEVEDEQRLEGQAEEIRNLFFARRAMGLLVSTCDMRDIASQYQARLYELRRWLVQHQQSCIDNLTTDEWKLWKKTNPESHRKLQTITKATIRAEIKRQAFSIPINFSMIRNMFKGIHYYKIRPLRTSTFYAKHKDKL